MSTATGSITGRAFFKSGCPGPCVNAEATATWPTAHAHLTMTVYLEYQKPDSSAWVKTSTQTGEATNRQSVYAGNGAWANRVCSAHGVQHNYKWRCKAYARCYDANWTLQHVSQFIGNGQVFC
jgi:hypothetical protein